MLYSSCKAVKPFLAFWSLNCIFSLTTGGTWLQNAEHVTPMGFSLKHCIHEAPSKMLKQGEIFDFCVLSSFSSMEPAAKVRNLSPPLQATCKEDDQKKTGEKNPKFCKMYSLVGFRVNLSVSVFPSSQHECARTHTDTNIYFYALQSWF